MRYGTFYPSEEKVLIDAVILRQKLQTLAQDTLNRETLHRKTLNQENLNQETPKHTKTT